VRLIGLFLSFIFFFQNSAFAKADCETMKIKLDIVSAHIKKLYDDKGKEGEDETGNPYDNFLIQVNLKNHLHSLTSDPTKGVHDLEDMKNLELDYEVLSPLDDSCKKFHESDPEDAALKASCDAFVYEYLTEEKTRGEINEQIKSDLEVYSNKIKEVQESTHFKSLKQVHKAMALDIMDNECALIEGEESEILDILCDRGGLNDVEPDGLDQLVQDNMKVILELNKKLNEPKNEDVERSCAMLKGVPLATKTAVEKRITDSKGDLIDFGYEDGAIQYCDEVLEKQAQRVKQEAKEDEKKRKEEEKKKKDDERKKKNNASNKEVNRDKEKNTNTNKESVTKNRTKAKTKRYVSPETKRKRSRFWKTTGTIAAAVGVSGLLGYGLYKLFDSTVATSNPYVAPTNTYTYPRNFYNYQMDPYESFQYQQYMYNGYMQSPNWVGQMPYDNSPYSFEFGQ
jgi:hypothetical protein